jgi:hypothetical protein
MIGRAVPIYVFGGGYRIIILDWVKNRSFKVYATGMWADIYMANSNVYGNIRFLTTITYQRTSRLPLVASAALLIRSRQETHGT